MIQIVSGTENKAEERLWAIFEKEICDRCFVSYEEALKLKRMPMVIKLLGKDEEYFTTFSDQKI
ncbi:hypothetical protein AALD22_09400 [Lachnospiraceae bacterium 56-18]|jgi:hypothetical protein